MKRSEIRRFRATIRQLKPGEPIPAGEPRRYTSDSRGYVRLRWKVAKGEYVETYEHRLVAGVPAAEVHHENEDKADNRPGNLHVLSKVEHAREHGARLAAQSKRTTEWGGAKSRAAFEKRERAASRRGERKKLLTQIAGLYRQGYSTVDIGEYLGRDPSNISRALRAAGVVPAAFRSPRGGTRVAASARQIVHARAEMCCEVCGTSLVWAGGQIHHRRPRRMGSDRRPETNRASNLLYLCGPCHDGIESRRQDALGRGLLVHANDEPAAVPVTCRYGHVLLDDEGRWTEVPS